MKWKQLVYGIATFIPGVTQLPTKGTGGTVSARYCYSVWLRHLVEAEKNGLNTRPNVIAELGPGDSLGIGLAALISGSEKYFAFDVVNYANTQRNLEIFDDLITLFRNRAPIPGDDEFPKVKPYLDNYTFPSHILDDDTLNWALEPSRIERIRNSLAGIQDDGSIIQYKVPWYDASVLERESVDMIYSQAVLEHVDDLQNTYESMRLWLKHDGYISHQIDFKSHGTATEWNGHWTYSDFVWKLIRGKRPFLLNRATYSQHIATMKAKGFDIVCVRTIETESQVKVTQLAPKFRALSETDLITSGAFVQGVKTGSKSN